MQKIRKGLIILRLWWKVKEGERHYFVKYTKNGKTSIARITKETYQHYEKDEYDTE